jgi:Calcineurin-like phosphoesterase
MVMVLSFPVSRALGGFQQGRVSSHETALSEDPGIGNNAHQSGRTMINGYDLIGDIHGHCDKLLALLRMLGDLIDRGPSQVATAMRVRRMVDAGSARCLMGNHEFNAIAWNTPDPLNPGEYLRPHGKPDNRVQHAAYLAEVEGRPIHAELTDWFRTFPLSSTCDCAAGRTSH